MARMTYARPSSSFGYWRGGMPDGPLALGQGSGMGQANQGVGILPPGVGSTSDSGWSPTVIYLLILILAEMVIFKCLERMLR